MNSGSSLKYIFHRIVGDLLGSGTFDNRLECIAPLAGQNDEVGAGSHRAFHIDPLAHRRHVVDTAMLKGIIMRSQDLREQSHPKCWPLRPDLPAEGRAEHVP